MAFAGGCVRLKETLEQRLHVCAKSELGTDVLCDMKPVLITENIEPKRDRGRTHFISFLYQCVPVDKVQLRLLVNIGGLYGILLSTIISMSFVSLPWLVMNLFNFVFRRSSSEYISILIQNVIVVIVDMIVCYAICQMVHLGGIMTIIFRGAVCVVFSNISYFAIWKNNEDFKDAIKLLNSIFKGKR